MSHFSVMVRVPASAKGSIEEAVGRLMVPYCEHDNGGRTKPYMEWKDTTEEHRQKYENDSVEMVKFEDGRLVLPWDERFRKSGTWGTGSDTHEAPAHLERVDVPFKETYPTFEDFCLDWMGETPNAEGRYGYHHNPNAKWDYWRIGGRWRGDLFIKKRTPTSGLSKVSYEWEFEQRERGTKIPGGEREVDYCQICDLDMDRIAEVARERTDEFFANVETFISGTKKWHPFEGPRDAMLRLGILDCKGEDEFDKSKVFWWQKWDNGRERYDVIATKPDKTALYDKALRFFNPIRPYAYLDETGWHAPGRMGWFGASSDEAEDNFKYGEEFERWIKSGEPTDFIVMVDCHI